MMEKVYGAVPPEAATRMVPSLKQIDGVVVLSVIVTDCPDAPIVRMSASSVYSSLVIIVGKAESRILNESPLFFIFLPICNGFASAAVSLPFF